jgi:hypothetical protein
MIGLYANCLPQIENGVSPTQDMSPQGINLQSGHKLACHAVYDGTIFSIDVTDMTNSKKAYFQWPVNIPAIVGASTALMGVTGGVINPANVYYDSWSWWQGYNTRLATPTISPTAGQYAATQTITISGPAGATIYYTIDGTPPTTASSVYSGALTVSASTLVKARACGVANFTDSFIAESDYQIQTSGLPTINFPSGFGSGTGAAGRIAANGSALFSGSDLQLTQAAASYAVTGSAFYLTPVPISAFTSVFEFAMASSSGTQVLFFALQNQLSASTDSSTTVCVSGGPYAIGYPTLGPSQPCGGYTGLSQSVGFKIDAWNGTVGLYLNGVNPSGSDTALTGVSLTNGHTIKTTIAYSGTTASLTLEDMTTLATFTHTWTGVDIPTAVGASTAYVGFTASDYAHATITNLLNWTM